MRILLAILLIFGTMSAYASEDTTNYGWTIPAIGDRDWQSTISEDMVSQDAITKMLSLDAAKLQDGTGTVYVSEIGVNSLDPVGTFHTVQGGATNSVYHQSFSTVAGEGTELRLTRSNNATAGIYATTTAGQQLSRLTFSGIDSGGNLDQGAQIICTQSGDASTRIPSVLTFTLYNATQGKSDTLRLSGDGGVLMYNMKTGTTQANAEAAYKELWADTDDGYTIKLGT